MPKMQVTFSEVSRSVKELASGSDHATLVFQIGFRGKSYDCVGHVRQNTGDDSQTRPVKFSGYCGYNGPINIQKLSNAAIDYYQSIIDRVSFENDLVASAGESKSKKLTANEKSTHKSYEFNVGKRLLTQAS